MGCKTLEADRQLTRCTAVDETIEMETAVRGFKNAVPCLEEEADEDANIYYVSETFFSTHCFKTVLDTHWRWSRGFWLPSLYQFSNRASASVVSSKTFVRLLVLFVVVIRLFSQKSVAVMVLESK